MASVDPTVPTMKLQLREQTCRGPPAVGMDGAPGVVAVRSSENTGVSPLRLAMKLRDSGRDDTVVVGAAVRVNTRRGGQFSMSLTNALTLDEAEVMVAAKLAPAS